MKLQVAILTVLSSENLSKYRLAKELGLASSTSINQWLRGNTRISVKFADKFELLYGIKIDDAVSTSNNPQSNDISYTKTKQHSISRL